MTKKPILIASGVVLVVFVAVALSPTHHAQGLKTLNMYAAYVQEGAPVQLESVTHNLEFLFSKADVKNVSDRTVRSVTFGVLLSEPNRPELVLASRQEVPTDIKPGATRAVDVLALPVKEGEQTALQFRSNQVIVSFGVLGVRFDDGTSWNFDPLKNGGFIQGSQTPPSAKVNCVPRPSSGVMTLLDKILPTALAQTVAKELLSTKDAIQYCRQKCCSFPKRSCRTLLRKTDTLHKILPSRIGA